MTRRAGLFEDVDAAGVSTFGDQITVNFSDLPAEVGDGVFEAPGDRVEVVDGIPIVSTLPSVGLHLADWSRAPRRSDTITVAGVEYNVSEVDPDGFGGVTVTLVRPRP